MKNSKKILWSSYGTTLLVLFAQFVNQEYLHFFTNDPSYLPFIGSAKFLPLLMLSPLLVFSAWCFPILRGATSFILDQSDNLICGLIGLTLALLTCFVLDFLFLHDASLALIGQCIAVLVYVLTIKVFFIDGASQIVEEKFAH